MSYDDNFNYYRNQLGAFIAINCTYHAYKGIHDWCKKREMILGEIHENTCSDCKYYKRKKMPRDNS